MENLARKVLAVQRETTFAQVGRDTAGLSVRFMDPGTPTLSARADAALKYTQAFPTGDPEVAMEMYGLSEEQIQRNLTYMRKAQANSLIDQLTKAAEPATDPVPAGNVAEPAEES